MNRGVRGFGRCGTVKLLGTDGTEETRLDPDSAKSR